MLIHYMTLTELLEKTANTHMFTVRDLDYIYFINGIKIRNNWFDKTPNPYKGFQWEYKGNSKVEVEINSKKKELNCDGFTAYIDKVTKVDANLLESKLDKVIIL